MEEEEEEEGEEEGEERGKDMFINFNQGGGGEELRSGFLLLLCRSAVEHAPLSFHPLQTYSIRTTKELAPRLGSKEKSVPPLKDYRSPPLPFSLSSSPSTAAPTERILMMLMMVYSASSIR